MISILYTCFIVLLAGDVLIADESGNHNSPDAHGHTSKLHDGEFLTNEEHMKTHHAQEFGEENDVSKMSHEEQEFRFFFSHDFNNDTSLDGLEIYHAISHGMTEEAWVEWEQTAKEGYDRVAALAEMVDQILVDDDLDKDGYITYQEFSVLRRREAHAAANSVKA